MFPEVEDNHDVAEKEIYYDCSTGESQKEFYDRNTKSQDSPGDRCQSRTSNALNVPGLSETQVLPSNVKD